MNEKDLIKRLNHEIDNLLSKTAKSDEETPPTGYTQVLNTLINADFSHKSQVRQPLRRKLLSRMDTPHGHHPKNSRLFLSKPSYSWAEGIAMAVLVIVALAFVIPQSRVLAESIFFKFFQPAQATAFPLSDTAIAQGKAADPTYPATFAVQLKPQRKTTPTLLETDEVQTIFATIAVPAIEGCTDLKSQFSYRCQLSLAERQMDFDAKEFPVNPQGFVLYQVSKGRLGRYIGIEYIIIGGGEYLFLTQGYGDRPDSGWSEVPANAIEKVTIGEYPGEYARGRFVFKNDAREAVWMPDAANFRLRWQEGDRWFELEIAGDVGPSESPDKESLIQLAASLVDEQLPQVGPRLDYLISIEEAHSVSPFDILEATLLPESFKFDYASYDEKYGQIRLNYGVAGNPGSAQFIILETLLDKLDIPGSSALSFFQLDGEKVDINGWEGVLIIDLKWNFFTLAWQTDTIQVDLFYAPSEWYGGQLTKEQFLEIARAIK